MRLVFLGILLLARLAVAAPQDEIKRAYFRSTNATKMKYLDGVYCIRSPQFQLTSQEGMRLDLKVERTRWEQVLLAAVSVDEKVDILSFRQPQPGRAQCKVRYTTRLVNVDPLTDKEVTQVLVTDCLDEWSSTSRGWLLTSTKVTEQDFKR